MRIASILPESTIDYPGKYGPVIFTLGCNYNCPSCHNSGLADFNGGFLEGGVIDRLVFGWKQKAVREWYDGLTISGGEPTLQQDLISFARRLKQETGLAVKLDTNGSQFGVLQRLLEETEDGKPLVDYVAMDVKGPPQLYSQLSGRHIDLRDDVQKGMGLVTRFPDYEFRTTVVPVFENENLRWMSVDEIKQTAEFIVRETDSKEHKYFLQKFVGRSLGEGVMVDERFTKENLQEAGLGYETPRNLLEEMKGVVGDILPRVKVR